MSQKLDPIVYRGMHRGMNYHGTIADSLMPNTQFRLLLNIDNDNIGFPTRRNGYARIGSAAVNGTNPILGLIHHTPTTSANNQLVAFTNYTTVADSYYLSGTTWTRKSLSFTASTKVRCVTFLDYLIAVNGVDNPKSWTGAAADAWGTTNLTSAPVGSFIETFRQQVYIGNTSTDKIQWSSIPTGGVITWPASGNDFLCNPNDGSRLTGMKRYGNELLIGKGNFIYRFNGSSIDPDPVIKNGFASQESIAVTPDTLWFFDGGAQGMFGYAGGYPTWISKAIDPFIKAIPTSYHSSVSATSDNDHVEWFIGSVTINGLTFTNCSARYTISTQLWSIRTYANSFNVFADYDDGTSKLRVGGTTVSDVVKMNTGNSDLGTGIDFRLETPWYIIGNNPAVLFKLSQFSTFIENSSSVQVSFKTDIDNTWRNIGTCRSFVNTWSGLNSNFHRIAFRFVGYSDADPMIFDGFSILSSALEGIDQNPSI